MTNSARMDSYWRRREEEKLDKTLFIATLEGVKTPEQELIERQTVERLSYHIDQLQPRIGRAVRMYYGIGCEPHSYGQIAEEYGLTRSRVAQIVAKGERALKQRVILDLAPERWRKERERWAEEYRAREAARRAKDAALNAAHAAQWARENAEYEAQRARARREWEAQEAIREYDHAYVEAHRVNALWDEEVKRRTEEKKTREARRRRARKRERAFEMQNEELRASVAAYYATVGTPEAADNYAAVLRHLKDWGPRQARIWEKYPS